MMRVLFLSKADKPDYMCDMVYHGLKTSKNVLVEELNTPHYMYSYYLAKSRLYGRGFTLYGQLSSYPTKIGERDMAEKIKNRYFDYIFFGSIQRYDKNFDFIANYYEKEKIIVIDGEDEPSILFSYSHKANYFKRELQAEHQQINPINFAVPSHLIVNTIPNKNKRVATIIPGDLTTYVFEKQEAYYADYQHSSFGTTCKKAGWDCLRHYEILMNGCIPYFIGLQECPPNTMRLFPKEIVLETNQWCESDRVFDEKSILNELLEHTKNHLTTTSLIERILAK